MSLEGNWGRTLRLAKPACAIIALPWQESLISRIDHGLRHVTPAQIGALTVVL